MVDTGFEVVFSWSSPTHFNFTTYSSLSAVKSTASSLSMSNSLWLLRLLNILFSSAAKFSDASAYGRIRVICTSRARSMTMSSISYTCPPVFDTNLHGLVHVFISLGVMPGCLTLTTSTWSPTVMYGTTHLLSTPHNSCPIHAQQLQNIFAPYFLCIYEITDRFLQVVRVKAVHLSLILSGRHKSRKSRSTIGGEGGCHNFVPVLGGGAARK